MTRPPSSTFRPCTTWTIRSRWPPQRTSSATGPSTTLDRVDGGGTCGSTGAMRYVCWGEASGGLSRALDRVRMEMALNVGGVRVASGHRSFCATLAVGWAARSAGAVLASTTRAAAHAHELVACRGVADQPTRPLCSQIQLWDVRRAAFFVVGGRLKTCSPLCALCTMMCCLSPRLPCSPSVVGHGRHGRTLTLLPSPHPDLAPSSLVSIPCWASFTPTQTTPIPVTSVWWSSPWRRHLPSS